MRVLALVPARAGSRGIPGKNLKEVAGRSLIAWTAAAARESGVCDRAVLTTDDPDIAEEGRRRGLETPFLRPPELARDDTPGLPPVLHALRWLADHEGYAPSHVLLLQPTSPLRTADDIRAAVRIAEESGADSVVSVCAARSHPAKVRRIDDGGRLVPWPGSPSDPALRQDLPDAYDLNGAIYLTRADVLLREGTFFPPDTRPYVMPPERSVDVDTPWDMRLVENVLSGPHERE